jgi:hypothetical protein
MRRALAHEVERLRDELLAAAGFAFDQHRERGVRELADLLAELFDQNAVPEQPAMRGFDLLGVLHFERTLQKIAQCVGLARLVHEIDCAECSGMARVRLVALA